MDCKGLKKAVLPDNLETIGKECFSWSGLEKIAIPKSVKVIADCAFSWCQNLWKVVFQEGSQLRKL